MDTPPPKTTKNKSNQIYKIYRRVKAKHPKKTPKRSDQKTEATKVNATTGPLNDSDENQHNTSINQFIPLFE